MQGQGVPNVSMGLHNLQHHLLGYLHSHRSKTPSEAGDEGSWEVSPAALALFSYAISRLERDLAEECRGRCHGAA